jgi:hypothetical protein
MRLGQTRDCGPDRIPRMDPLGPLTAFKVRGATRGQGTGICRSSPLGGIPLPSGEKARAGAPQAHAKLVSSARCRVTGKMAPSTNPGTSSTAVSVALAGRGWSVTTPARSACGTEGSVSLSANDRGWRASESV